MTPDKQDYHRKLTLYLVVLLFLAMIGSILLIELAHPFGLYIWIALMAGGLYLLVRWHAANSRYECGHCGNVFKISARADFISIHSMSGKRLICPRCHRRSCCRAMPAE